MLRRRVSTPSISAAVPAVRLAASTSVWRTQGGRPAVSQHPIALEAPATKGRVRVIGCRARQAALFASSHPLLRYTVPGQRAETPEDSATRCASPYTCTVDSVLQPASNPDDLSLRALVSLLIDPDAKGVEAVSLQDFVAMVPSRQRRAVGGQAAWHDVLLGAEKYHACKDARALRLAGITSVGAWEEKRDRVPISAYSRGLLEQAYRTLTQSSQSAQRDEVMAWLTQAIQRAVREEFTPSVGGEERRHAPLLSVSSAAITPHEESIAAMPEEDPGTPDAGGRTEERSRSGRKGATRRRAANADAVAPGDADGTPAAEAADEDAESAHLTGEAGTARAPHIKAGVMTRDAPKVAADVHQEADADGEEYVRLAAEAEEGMMEEVEEFEEVIEEVEEELAADAEEDATPATTTASEAAFTTVTATSGSNDKATEAKLRRLADLIVIQFNSADGYLHCPRKELRTEEKSGSVVITDDDTAHVDPLALFSTYHAAHVGSNSPTEVQALKKIWNRFNIHQMGMEDAKDERSAMFERQKSVDALVHGAVLMRAISREEDPNLEYDETVPAFGFPLLSSDKRPYHTKKPKSSPHTDVTFMTVDAAISAFKRFFANKDFRSTPFIPKVDVNAGCGVVKLSGTTLHLYETSIKEVIEEEAVRPLFAEAMLGLLHVLQHKVLPRVNTVHYHILVTSLPPPSSPTSNFVSVDLTGPFTATERTRLQALAEPLGFTKDQLAEFTCVEDIIMEIQDATGVSVVHDLLQNRDDLEAMLTPTLVELLPEDAVLDEDEECDGVAAAAEVAEPEESCSAESSSSGPSAAATWRRKKGAKATDVEDEEQYTTKTEATAEDDEVYTTASSAKRATATNRKTPTAAPTTPKTSPSSSSTSSPASGPAYDEYGDAAEEELYRRLLEEESAETSAGTNQEALGEDGEVVELEMEDDLPPTQSARGHRSSRGATSHSRANGKVTNRADEGDEEWESPRRGAVRGAAALSTPVSPTEDIEGEEVVVAPIIPRAAAGRKAVPTVLADDVEPTPVKSPRVAASHYSRSAAAARANVASANDYADDDADVDEPPVVSHPVPARRGGTASHGRRAAVAPPPAANDADDDDADERAERSSQPVSPKEPQWFRRKSKRRYFS